MAVWSVLSPTPSWITIDQAGLLTIGTPPIAGYTGTARIQAVEGADTAILELPIAIQPSYSVTPDYVEIFDAAWRGNFGAVFDSVELEAPIDYAFPAIGTIIYDDVDLGGVGAGDYDVVIDGTGVAVDDVAVVINPTIASIPATFTTLFPFTVEQPIESSIPATFTSLFEFEAQLSIAYTQVMSYTVTHQRGAGQALVSAGNWANLNDGDSETGVYVDSGSFSRVIVNLGSALTIQEIRLDGGFILGIDLAISMNGLDLQYANSDSGPWTTFAIVSGISDFGPPIIYSPNITAQYWRLADVSNPGLAACASLFSFYV
jgi:hypothetical protein